MPLPATSGPYIPPERTIDAATYTASKIRGFAGGAKAQYVALYATVRTDLNATTFTGGVYRCEITGLPTQPSGLANKPRPSTQSSRWARRYSAVTVAYLLVATLKAPATV